MNERATFLAVLVLAGLFIIAQFPMTMPIVILFAAWRAYVLLNPDKMNHDIAIVLRKATQVVTLFMVGFVALMLVIMSQSPIPPYVEITNLSTEYIQPEHLAFNPVSGLMYIMTGRPSVYYSGSPQTQMLPPMIQPEATPESLG
ncbi:MAG: hypothetical protein MUF38_10140 [Anaerolineae bacterium]|nr:hypothetical protein [Anaerolineae bacterium]